MSRRQLIVLAGLLLAAVLFVIVAEPQVVTTRYHFGNADRDGARALGLYMQANGWQVEPQVGQASAVPPATGVLLVPPEVLQALTEVEVAELLDWAESGGRLVALGPGLELTPDHLYGEWLSDLRVRAVEPSPHFPGVNKLANTFQRWRSGLAGVGEAWDVWLRDGLGIIVLRRPHGRGELIFLADPAPLTNAALTEADNLAFALQVLAADERAALGWYMRDPATIRRQVASERAARALPLSWQLAGVSVGLAAVAAFWLLGRRTGPVLPPEPPPARPLTEYVTAQAYAYLRAGAGSAALQFIGQALRRELAAVSGLPPTAPVGQLAEACARLGLRPEEVESVLTQLEAGEQRAPADVHRLAAAAAALQRRMKRVRGADSSPRR